MSVFLWLLVLAAATWLCLATPAGCARISHPGGGPKDSLPPVLLKTQPAQGALSFKGKRISIYFNEYVQLKETDKHFLMSPPPEKRPSLNIRGKSVQVDFNSPLRDSATYLLDFGSAIVDNNEGNPYPPYRFSFSTGAWLDTLSVEGLALDAYTDQPASNVLVYLYENTEDSVVLKQRPDNVTRPSAKGLFLAGNLKSKPYKMLAIADANKNYKYDVGQEAIGFLDPAVAPVPLLDWHGDDTVAHLHKIHEAKLVLRMFTEDFATQYLTSCERPQQRVLKLTFNAPFPTIDSLAIDSVEAATLTPEYSAKHDTITYWFSDTAARIPDTMRLRFVYLKTDTLGQLSPFAEKRQLIFTPKKQETPDKDKKEKSTGFGGLLNRLVSSEEVVDSTPKKPAHWTLKPKFSAASASPIDHASLSFDALPIAVNPDLVTFEELQINPRTKDSSYVGVKFSLIRDSLNLRRYSVAAGWKELTTYRYMMLPNAFWDVYAQTNDTIKGTFTTVNPDNMSKLTLNFTQAKGSYVVQLTDAKGQAVIRRQLLSEDKKIDFLYLAPGTYCIRVIKDDNSNGKWDTGNYFKHIHPEYATFLKENPEKTTFELKQGWDVELNVDLKNLFPDSDDGEPQETEPLNHNH
ncbi:MAG: Ig-like domain-containing protein [Prevotellaceae bacterium]|nr:Ig-like domain-containing protein [Prevotellaceae bacterium]